MDVPKDIEKFYYVIHTLNMKRFKDGLYKKSYKIRTKIFKPLIKIENALDYSRDHLNQPY